MLTVCWSAKGGSGTTTVAAALALLSAPSADTLALDLCGELGAVLGVEPPNATLNEWFETDGSADDLTDVAIDVRPNLRLIAASGPIRRPSRRRMDELLSWLALRRGHTIVDAGLELNEQLLDLADRSVLVTRACYLAVQRAVARTVRPTHLVVVREASRSLSDADVAAALGVDVTCSVPFDAAVARAVDAGLLNARLPRSLARPLGVMA